VRGRQRERSIGGGAPPGMGSGGEVGEGGRPWGLLRWGEMGATSIGGGRLRCGFDNRGLRVRV
jgi:hypothetical protein